VDDQPEPKRDNEAGGKPAVGPTLGGPVRGPGSWKPFRRQMNEAERKGVLDQLYFEGDQRQPFLRRFTILLSFSVLIAVLGLANDSGPVVIGAMLVSPLTTPLLGLAAALVMGWPRRQAESLLILLAGSAWAIALGFGALELIPEPRSVTLQSSELLARTEPRLLDLVVAVVAGAAGAYVLIRREAIGALPGVAIAVALVPPISAGGMMLELGEPGLAGDALLLYATNLVGIVFAASLVLLASGMRPHTHDGKLPRRAKVGLAGAAIFVLLIAYPLGAVTERGLESSLERDRAQDIAESWVADTALRVTGIKAEADKVTIDVSGPDPPPPSHDLADQLADAFGEPIQLTLGWTREARIHRTGQPGS